MLSSHSQQVFDIREIFPYLANFHNQIFVISVDANYLLSKNCGLIEDTVLLASCGIRIILVPDESTLVEKITPTNDNLPRIISGKHWHRLSQQIAIRHFQIIANLNQALRKYHSKNVSIGIGNYIRAKPRGVIKGIDLGHNGKVRSINSDLLDHDFNSGKIILVPSIHPSPTGKLYWIAFEELCEYLSITQNVSKWIIVTKSTIAEFFSKNLLDQIGFKKRKKKSYQYQPSEITVDNLKLALKHQNQSQPILNSIISAINDGLKRVNIIEYDDNHNRNNLLQELFTHKGCGTVISEHSLDIFSKANIEDVSGIWSIINPLETNELLRPRTLSDIETNINNYFVISHDRLIIACAALIPLKDQKNAAELAAFAVATNHQKRGLGKKLLSELSIEAKKNKITKIYLLTINAYEWFSEHGFNHIKVKQLPRSKQLVYDKCRQAKILFKKI